jgi:hypothetical protein
LWTANRVNWGPEPFTASQNYITADTVVLQIDAARSKGQRLVLAMAGAAGQAEDYITNGQFDMTKWKNRMDTYDRDSIKAAVAAAVEDGTVVGNTLIDEPETKQWGNNITKGMIDEMAVYVKNMFPTLPVGVNHGPPAYLKWRTSEQYHVVDYVLYQFAHYVTKGDVVAWRDAVLAQAKSQGAAAALSLNILNGGPQDRDGTWDCQGEPGRGKRSPNCQISPTDLVNWAKQLAPYGCFLTLWRYDPTYMSDPVNVDAFKDIAAYTASLPRRSCKRGS